MSYNYTERYLRRYQDLVERLKSIWRTGTPYVLTYETQDNAKATQKLVRELLASMAFHYPDTAPMREGIRTWIEIDSKSGCFRLYIGKPRDSLAGRKPGELPLHRDQLSSAKEVTNIATSELDYNYPKIITIVHDLTGLMDHIIKVSGTPCNLFTVKSRIPIVSDSTEWLLRLAQNDGWATAQEATGPDTFITTFYRNGAQPPEQVTEDYYSNIVKDLPHA